MSVIRRDDDPVAVWVDDCGRSWVAAQAYATALEQRDEAWQEIERLSTNHRGAVGALGEINALAKYLTEPAWTEEGIRLVGEQIMRLAAPHLGGQ